MTIYISISNARKLGNEIKSRGFQYTAPCHVISWDNFNQTIEHLVGKQFTDIFTDVIEPVLYPETVYHISNRHLQCMPYYNFDTILDLIKEYTKTHNNDPHNPLVIFQQGIDMLNQLDNPTTSPVNPDELSDIHAWLHGNTLVEYCLAPSHMHGMELPANEPLTKTDINGWPIYTDSKTVLTNLHTIPNTQDNYYTIDRLAQLYGVNQQIILDFVDYLKIYSPDFVVNQATRQLNFTSRFKSQLDHYLKEPTNH